MKQQLLETPINQLIKEYPYAEDYIKAFALDSRGSEKTITEIAAALGTEFCEEHGINREQLTDNFMLFMEQMEAISKKNTLTIDSVTILPGHDKSGTPEAAGLTLRPGVVHCILGPTGSGKSRLLGDIECLAQNDTPTGRSILVNGNVPGFNQRFGVENKLIAQLSQNMNFVMDLSAGDFVTMHAESRMINNIEEIVSSVIACANELAGEKFVYSTPLTQLSGGQSRSLMIADTALLSRSPIILIDEIENAGVDRKKALELLVKKEKIVLMSTHDPILALMGDIRIIIKNGGIHKILNTTEGERESLAELIKMDTMFMDLRNALRSGDDIVETMRKGKERLYNPCGEP